MIPKYPNPLLKFDSTMIGSEKGSFNLFCDFIKSCI